MRIMPKRKQKRPVDINRLARQMVKESTEQDIVIPTKAQISVLMAQLGRKGGKIGGKRRLETMSAAKRSEIAKKAAQARWHHKNTYIGVS
jgi:hypothetical protein